MPDSNLTRILRIDLQFLLLRGNVPNHVTSFVHVVVLRRLYICCMCKNIFWSFFFSGTTSIAQILVLCVLFYESFKGLFKDTFMQG